MNQSAPLRIALITTGWKKKSITLYTQWIVFIVVKSWLLVDESVTAGY